MPRVIFSRLADIATWIDNKVDPNKYESYVTEKKEVILAPTKSTPPITFGYIRTNNVEDLKSILAQIKGRGIDIYRCSEYDWKTDAPIGSIYANGD